MQKRSIPNYPLTLSLLGVAISAMAPFAQAQTFKVPAVATSSTLTAYTELAQSQAVAVDSSGNLFYSLPGSGSFVEQPAGGGATIPLYTIANGGAGYPKGVATNGIYAYMTDYGGHLWQVPVGGGAAVDVLSACGPIDGYYLGSQEVATDGLGNIYVAGNNETTLFKITSADACSAVSNVTLDANSHVAADAAGDLAYSTGGVLYSLPANATTPVTVPGTFNSIIGLRADATGNVFVTTYSGIVEVPFINGALNGADAFTVLAASSQNDVAVAIDGTIYTTDGTNLYKNRIGNVRFASSTVGTLSATQTVNVVFNNAETLTSLRLASGTGTSSEIVNAGTGTCATGVAYGVGSTCTLNLTFTPSKLGARNGAVVFSSASGVVGMVAVGGQGSGAGLVVDPGTQSTLGSGWTSPSGIAVDPSGAVLVADTSAGTLSYIPSGNTTPTVIASGLSKPTGVAFAADGTAYVSNIGANTLVQVPFNGTTYGTASSVVTGLQTPSSLAIAPDGSLYIANTAAATVVRIPNQAGTLNFYDQVVVGSGFKAPVGLAFDASGNLFVADKTASSISEITGISTATVATGLSSPSSVAVDDSGSLYILQTGIATILRIPYSNGSYGANTTTALGTGFVTPSALAADAAGNLYVADSGAPSVTVIERTAGSLNLGRVNVGDTSAAQSLALSNDGDTSLSFGSPLYTPSGDTADFTVGTAGSDTCAAAGSLVPGAGCAISGTFSPTGTGSLTDTLMIASDAANASPISGAFTGTGINLPKTTLALSISPSGSVTYGTSIVATANVTTPTGSTVAATGTITFLVNGTAYATVNLSSGSASATIAGLPAGSDTVNATYSGDDNYAGSTGTAVTVNVALAPTTTTFISSISSATPVPPGTSVTLSATITSAVTTASPSGTVNFVSNGTTLASAAVNSSTGVAALTLTTLPTGTYPITAVYSGDSGFATSSSAAISVSILAPQYVFAGIPTALTVGDPGSVSATFTLAPISGYVGGVDMSCSGLPANTQCTFLPATVAFNGTNLTPQNVTLTITTATPPPTTVAGWLLPFGVLMLLGAWRHRKSIAANRSLLMIVFALGSSLALLAISGCGNSSSNNNTPAGTSTVTVNLIGTPNGTTTVPTSGAGNIPSSFSFQLTVK
jgi:sugar lactone lactonase YvrE